MINSENFDKIITFMLKALIDILHQMEAPFVAMKSSHYEFSVNKEIFILGIKGVSSRNEVVQLLRSYPSIKRLYTIKTLSLEVQKFFLIQKIRFERKWRNLF
jgi:hypothetical protein